jgi:hypothetical protein
MELDDLKKHWQERGGASLQLNAERLRAAALDRVRTSMDWLARGLWIEAALNAVAVLWLGSFAADHVTSPRFAVPAAALLAGTVALVASGLRQLVALRRMDYGLPVVPLQQQLEALRVRRIRAVTWTLLLAPLAWTPLLIVALKGFLGVDAYAALGAPWLASNALFGAAVLAAARWCSRRYADRMAGSPRVQRLMQTLAGHHMAAATAYLASLGELERET